MFATEKSVKLKKTQPEANVLNTTLNTFEASDNHCK